MTTATGKKETTVNMLEAVKCSECGWEGRRCDAAFGHDDFYCPKCLKEGCLETLHERIQKTAAQIYRESVEWEASVKVGDEAIARWTNCGHYHTTVVRVRKINGKSFGVDIVAPLDGYPAGWHIGVPRIADIRRWSYNNRLEAMS